MNLLSEVVTQFRFADMVVLFASGFFHADPHPGNLLYLNNPTEEGQRLALIDCGLMASIGPADRDNMISAVIHLANKDYANLVDDFIKLKILPSDTNRAAVIPLMDKALSPYVKGGGAKKYEEELRKLYGMEDTSDMQQQVGGFQAMTQDALTVLNDIPFSIPPYFAILGRAIVTLEGVALTGNPNYGIIKEAFPFISRKLLSEDRPEIQRALQEVLYTGDDAAGLKLSRLLSLLNNAAGSTVAKEGAAFVDLDAIPENGISFSNGLKVALSDKAESLRTLLEPEVDAIVDVLTRQLFRKAANEAIIALTPPRPPALPFLGDILPPGPKLDEIPLPFLLPSAGEGGLSRPSIAVVTWNELIDAIAPKLDQDEEIYAVSLSDAAREFFGDDVAAFVKGEGVLSAKTAELVLAALRSGVVGQSDLLNSENTQRIVEAAGNIVSQVRGSSSQSAEFERELEMALAELDDAERGQLDQIIEELVQRNLRRVLERLSKVNRVI